MKAILLPVLAGMIFAGSAPEFVWAGDPQANCAATGNGDCPTNGNQNSTPANSDPINMATGVFTISRTDISLPGPMPITFTRTYNGSVTGYPGILGFRWTDNCHKYLTFGSAGVGYNRGDGVSIPIYYNSPTQGVSKENPCYTWTKVDPSHSIISDKFGNKEYYTASYNFAYITKATDRNGNELDYTYSSESSGYFALNTLSSVQDPVSGRYIAFGYDPTTGQITTIVDSGGRQVHYAYAAEGDLSMFLSSVTYPATNDYPEGTTETYGHDTDFNLTTVTDGNGHVIVSNVYGTAGQRLYQADRVTQQTANGGTSSIVYNDANNEITWTDYKGFVTDYYNDGNGNITSQTVHTTGLHSGVPSGTTYSTVYTYGTGSGSDGPAPDSSQPNNCYKTKETDPNGNGTSWTYDQYGNVLTVTKFMAAGTGVGSIGTQATTSTTTYTYDSQFNQVASVTDPDGKVTTYTYDDGHTGNLLKITYPTTAAGTAQETFTYNSAGQVLTDTTPDGTVTQNTYDATGGDLLTGYLTKTIKDYGTGKLNATTQYTYDNYGNVEWMQDPLGSAKSYSYDAMDHLILTEGSSGQEETCNYDGDGHLVTDQKSAPSSQVEKTTYVYNTNEDLVATRHYTSPTAYLETDYAYDLNDNRTTVTDPLGHSVSTAYDERDKPYIITDAQGNTTHDDYDPNGNLTKLTDELGHVTTYTFDGLNRMEQKTFPDSSYQTWTYDATGNITSLQTAAGNTITQTYDARNRMLTQVYPVTGGTSTITNVYDIMGRVLTTSQGGTSLTYVYDDLGRNTSFTDQAGLASTYTYDLDGHRLTSTYPTGVEVKRAYDASNRLSTLKDGSNNTMATNSYDILDRLTGTTLANGTSVAYGYDLLNRLGYVDNTLGGTTTRNYSYVYDNANRVTQITEPRGVISAGYTYRNEVNSITEPTGSPFADQSFGYDAGWNRSSWTLGSSTTSYAVNNLNEYTTVSGTTAPTWNSDGGLHVYAGNTYTYDALQRLTEVDYSAGKTLFSYDPLGRRVKKVDENSGGTVLATYQYHYDGSEVAVEYQPSTTWTYYLGIGLDQVVLRYSSSAKQWYYRDGHGSTSAVADNSGNVLENYEYNAQGQVQITNASGTVESTTQIANDLLYTGRNYDNETGNYFYRARYYNPVLGRFISRDPLSGAEFSQGTNLYAYCRNNFLNASDPTGMCLKDGKLTLGGDWNLSNDPLNQSLTYNGNYAPSPNSQMSPEMEALNSEMQMQMYEASDAGQYFANLASSGDDGSDFVNAMTGGTVSNADIGLNTNDAADILTGGDPLDVGPLNLMTNAALDTIQGEPQDATIFRGLDALGNAINSVTGSPPASPSQPENANP